jgi:hypothetical protein
LKKKGQDKIQPYPDMGDDDVVLEKPSDDDMVVANQQLDKWKEHLGMFEFQMGLGGAPNLSKELANNYETGFAFDFGLGHRFSQQFSLLLDCDGTISQATNNASNADLTLSNLNFALLAKFRLTEKGLRPYVFFGPGLGGNSSSLTYSSNGLNGKDTISQGDFLAEGGLGIEVPILKYMYVFAQGKVVYNFENTNFASFSGTDNNSVYLPIEIGLVLAK